MTPVSSTFRILLRGLRLASVTAVGSCVVLALHLLRRWAPVRAQRLRNRVFRFWARDFCRAVGMRVRVQGRGPVGRFFLVCNHVSYTDIPLLASQVDTAFVGKADLRRWPLLGLAFRATDTIFIDRGRKRDLLRVLELVRRCLERGLGVTVFPEATSTKGETILRFKPSLLQLAAKNKQPVHYATLSYRTPPGWPPAHQLVCWWDGTPFLRHLLRLLAAPGFEARLEFGPEPISDSDRKVLADRLQAAMERSFQPIL